MDARRVLWTAIVLLFATMAVLGPVLMIRESTRGAEAKAATGGGTTVTMARIAYSPTTLAVTKGAEVTFDNKDVAPHTVTGAGIDSGIINPGKSFTAVINSTLEYHCEIHPSMKARIVLEG